MTVHGLTHEEARRTPVRRVGTNRLLQLGWPHFWTLAGILGGMLALVALVFFAALATR
jgi:hypothetical protein